METYDIKKLKHHIGFFLLFLFVGGVLKAQPTDFVPGANTIFEDRFELDAEGDFPAKWSTNGEGTIVKLDNAPGKWLRITQPTAVSPELKKSLPEDCTIEFDLYLKSTSGGAPLIMFGTTTLSDVSVGEVFRSHLSVKMHGYNDDGSLRIGKNIQNLGEKKFPLNGYVERVLHVSMSLNKTRWRVYLDDTKVVDLPKVLTPEYRKNFFVASAVIIPNSEEGVYISNIRIAAGEPDARSLLIKQLLEQGNAVTNEIQYTPNNQFTPTSQPIMDQLGQAMQQNPDMNIQVNSMEELPQTEVWVDPSTGFINEEADEVVALKKALKIKADKIKTYLVNKFKIKADRIMSDVKLKTAEAGENNKTVGKVRKLLTEFVKL
jgi:hypothetical protein